MSSATPATPGAGGAGRAAAAAQSLGLAYDVTRHGPVSSLAEAAAARGVEPRQVVKTMVVRVSEGDHRFVLVPGDREIAWPKLRALLGVNRISMPSADEALDRHRLSARHHHAPRERCARCPSSPTSTSPGRSRSAAATTAWPSPSTPPTLLGVLDATVADVTDAS